MTEQRSGGGARSIRQRGDRPSEMSSRTRPGGGAAAAQRSGSAKAASVSAWAQPGHGSGLLPRALCVWSNTPPAEIAQATPLTTTTSSLLRQLSPRGRAALQNGEQRARKGAPALPLPCTRACRPSCGEFADVTVAGRRVLPSARDPLGNCTSAVVTFYGM